MLQSILTHQTLTGRFTVAIDAPLVLPAGRAIHWWTFLGLAKLWVILKLDFVQHKSNATANVGLLHYPFM